MQAKEYIDPEAGRVLLVKSAASRRVSIRVHPADGVKVIVPRSLSYDEGLRFFMLKRDWVIATIAKQKNKISAAVKILFCRKSFSEGERRMEAGSLCR